MRIIYITSLFSQHAGSGSIQNLGYINGLGYNVGRENVDVLTVKWPDSMFDRRMLAMTEAGEIHYDEVSILTRYFEHGGKAVIERMLGGSRLLRKLKKLAVETVYFPSVDKEWIKTYSRLDFSQYDYIVTSSDTKTSHFIGAEIRSNYPNIKWIQIWGDPWCKDITIEPLTQLRAKSHERRLLAAADIVFYVSAPTLNEMRVVFPESAKKMHYIPRGYATEVVRADRPVDQSELVILYSGYLNRTRDISHFCRALHLFNSGSDIHVRLKICGVLDTYSKEAIKENSDIEFYGQMDYAGIIDEYHKCDALLYIGNPSGANQIPGKLFDYLGTDNSVLALVYNEEDEASIFLKNLDRVVLAVNRTDKIVDALQKIRVEARSKKLKPHFQFSSRSVMKDMLETSDKFIENKNMLF